MDQWDKRALGEMNLKTEARGQKGTARSSIASTSDGAPGEEGAKGELLLKGRRLSPKGKRHTLFLRRSQERGDRVKTRLPPSIRGKKQKERHRATDRA